MKRNYNRIKSKKARKAHNPKTEKSARIETLPNFEDMSPIWRFGKIDLGGQWGWLNVTKNELVKTILPRLKNLETMKWLDFVSDAPGCSHNVSLDRLCREARRRLEEINQSDIDELFSLVISGERRVWGIKSRQVLNIIWWDPKHEVCPVNLSHT